MCADLVRVQRHLPEPLEQLRIFFSQGLVLFAQLTQRGLRFSQLAAQFFCFRVILAVRLLYVLHDILALKTTEPRAAEAFALLVHLCIALH